jgi:EAL domain-containing protein (putative c-di-GMP-specific phosphodiesterase class I)
MGGEASNGHVLVVEDDPALLEIYAELLVDAGYAVKTALSGVAAMELLRDHDFDVVLSDIVMPDANGLELLRAVRRHDLDVPVILITGLPSVETAVEALELGALRYLIKPISESKLLQATKHAAHLHRLALLKRQALTHFGGTDKLLGDQAGLEIAFENALALMWMAYQPLITASDGSVFGHEALLRTDDPAVPNPGVFLDMADRLARGIDLGRQIRTLIASRRPLDGKTFINIHPDDLSDETLYDPTTLLTARARTVVLEITERSSLARIADLRGRVGRLRELGFGIAIDDLGAGYAGLTSFAALEPDMVKLDMSLVRDVDANPLKRKLIGSMVSLCRELGILVVAEGIETASERNVIVDLGCDLLQGFFLGRPARL